MNRCIIKSSTGTFDDKEILITRISGKIPICQSRINLSEIYLLGIAAELVSLPGGLSIVNPRLLLTPAE